MPDLWPSFPTLEVRCLIGGRRRYFKKREGQVTGKISDFLIVWLVFGLLYLFFAASFNRNFFANIDAFIYQILVTLVYSLVLYVYLRLTKR